MALRYLLVYILLASTRVLAKGDPRSSISRRIPYASNCSTVIMQQHGVKRLYGTKQLNGAHINVGFTRWTMDDSIFLFSTTMLEDLSKYLNFTLTLRTDFTLQEALTALENGQVDMDISLLTRTRKRAQLAQFITPMINSYYVAIIKKPQEKMTMINFLGPFDVYIWLCMISYLFVTASIVTVISRWSPTDNEHKENTESTHNPGYNLVYMSGSFLFQGGISLPRKHSSRILLSTWWLFVVVICALYNGTLVSFLAVQPKLTYPFRTVRELSLHPSIIPTTVEGWSVLEKLQRQPSHSDLGKIWQKMSADSRALANSTEASLNLVLNGDYTFLHSIIGADALFQADYALTGTCRLAIAPLKIHVGENAWIVPHNSSYEQGIRIGVQRYSQSGLFKRLRNRFLSRWPQECTHEKGIRVEAQRLGINIMSGILLVLPIGLGLSLVCILLEFVVMKWKGTVKCRYRGWRSKLGV
ncbi:PREDICTED: glutamate receptor 2-like [Priapulus caudatus]|uniref:Glutamate receptor 2-like n=1 Tax=Priapulus caudatus TaxID=37621 RepID=A0ABM1DZF9_PRICU|nr:PREDICTED: glutamate receptor 2-like [Priapulus caudatus]